MTTVLLEWVPVTGVLTLSRKHWKNHFMVYRLVNTSCLSCSSTDARSLRTKLTVMRRGGLLSHQVLLQSGHGLLQNAVVVLLETDQLWEARDEEP